MRAAIAAVKFIESHFTFYQLVIKNEKKSYKILYVRSVSGSIIFHIEHYVYA